jgi:hypothetical protein
MGWTYSTEIRRIKFGVETLCQTVFWKTRHGLVGWLVGWLVGRIFKNAISIAEDILRRCSEEAAVLLIG